MVKFARSEKLPETHHTQNFGVFVGEMNWLLSALIKLRSNPVAQNEPHNHKISQIITNLIEVVSEHLRKFNTHTSPIGRPTAIYLNQITRLCFEYCDTRLPTIDRLSNVDSLEINQEIVTLLQSIKQISESKSKFEFHLLTDKLDYLHTLSVESENFQFMNSPVVSNAIIRLCEVFPEEIEKCSIEKIMNSSSVFNKFHNIITALTHSAYASKHYHFIKSTLSEPAEWVSQRIVTELSKCLLKCLDLVSEVLQFTYSKQKMKINALGDFSSQIVWALHLLKASTPEHSTLIQNLTQPTRFHGALVRSMEKIADVTMENTVCINRILPSIRPWPCFH